MELSGLFLTSINDYAINTDFLAWRVEATRHTGSLPLMAATCRQSTISCIISLDLGAAGSLCRHLAEKREEGSLMTCSRSRS